MDADTCKASGWSSTDLRPWISGGAIINDWTSFPAHVQKDLERNNEGLTLHFSTRLTPFDRFLVDGVIFGVLGRDTDVHVAQYEVRGETAIIRLMGSTREDLEAVAEALWERVWERQQAAQEHAVVVAVAALRRLDEGLSAQFTGGLSDLRSRLDRIELRLPSVEGAEGLDSIGKDRTRADDLKVVRSWPQKVLAAVGGAVVKKATGIPLDVLGDVVKDDLTGGKELVR